jgi:hypothetical protein
VPHPGVPAQLRVEGGIQAKEDAAERPPCAVLLGVQPASLMRRLVWVWKSGHAGSLPRYG